MAKEFIIKEWQKKHLNEQGFDDRLKAAGGFSDEEFDDITSRDIEQPFPDPEPYRETAADKVIKQTIKPLYRNMSNDEMDSFSKEMVEYFLDNSISAQAAAKIWFGKKGL